MRSRSRSAAPCSRPADFLPSISWSGSWLPWSLRVLPPWLSIAGPTPPSTPRIRAPAPAPCPPGIFRPHSSQPSWSFRACVFILAASQLNRLTLKLSPVALAVLLLYSYTKRLTRWSHLVLGFALGIAPSAAWIAVRGSLDPRILLLTAAVTFWVGGFDVLYACQDYEFDRQAGLPLDSAIRRDSSRSLDRSRLPSHHGRVADWLVIVFGMGKLAMCGVLAVILLLLYEHSLVRPNDLSKLNAAFFTMNGVISVLFFVFVAADLLIRR